MATNFFQVALELQEYDPSVKVNAEQAYAFIQKYWKLSKAELATYPLDLEECFTLLQLKMASSTLSVEEKNQLNQVYNELTNFVYVLLAYFEKNATESEPMRHFGKILYERRPTIITFNYDTYIETLVKDASNKIPIPANVQAFKLARDDWEPVEASEEVISYSSHEWDERLAYGTEFDDVRLDIDGLKMDNLVHKEKFYSNGRDLYSSCILKLHGSLNWLRYLGKIVNVVGAGIDQSDKSKNIALDYYRPVAIPTTHNTWNAWATVPIIVPPVLYKQDLLNDKYAEHIATHFERLWTKAKKSLSICKHLIIIGYSFPPTDFHTKQLFLEAFADNQLDSLIIVNPDTSVVQKVKNLCHFEKPVIVCKDLREFLKWYESQKI